MHSIQSYAPYLATAPYCFGVLVAELWFCMSNSSCDTVDSVCAMVVPRFLTCFMMFNNSCVCYGCAQFVVEYMLVLISPWLQCFS
jgi:hypothetical protein